MPRSLVGTIWTSLMCRLVLAIGAAIERFARLAETRQATAPPGSNIKLAVPPVLGARTPHPGLQLGTADCADAGS